MERRVGKKFRLGRKVGSGSFGEVYIGTDIATGEFFLSLLFLLLSSLFFDDSRHVTSEDEVEVSETLG